MTIKIGLIGCGNIMRYHVEGWAAMAGQAEIVAVADVAEENIKARVAEIGREVTIYRDYHDLLADDSIDAVDIALPHHLHCESITAAARAGKHLMTEKPLCLSLTEAESIRQAVETSGIIMMAAHNQLFFPAVLQAKQMILHGDLGKIFTIHSYDCDARRGKLGSNKATWEAEKRLSLGGWRIDPAQMGGGEFIDTGYHPTYRLLFLAGESPVEVSAMLGTYRLDMDREDTAYLLAKFADGRIGQVMTSWAIRSPGARRTLFHIMAEAGQLWGEMDRLYYQPVNFSAPATVDYPGWTSSIPTFAAEIKHFVEAIEGGYQPYHSVAEATETLRVILAGYQSVETGGTVRVDSLSS
jgi:predicted dehydrogenase